MATNVTVKTSWIEPYPSSSYMVVQPITYEDSAVGTTYRPVSSPSVASSSSRAAQPTASPAISASTQNKTILSTDYGGAATAVKSATYYNAGITTDYSTYVPTAATAVASGSYNQTYGYGQDSGVNTTSIADIEDGQGSGSDSDSGGNPPLSRTAGIAIAVVVSLLVIGSSVGCCLYRRRRRRLNVVHGGEQSEKGFFGRAKRQRGVKTSRSTSESTSWGEMDVPALPSPTGSSNSPADEEYHRLQRSRSGRNGPRLSHRDLRHVVLSRPQPAVLYGHHSPTSATSLTSASPFMDPPLEATGSSSPDLQRTQSQFTSEYDFNSRRSESTYTDRTEYDMLAQDGSSYARTLSTYSEGVNSEYSERDLGYSAPVSAGPGPGTGSGTGTNASMGSPTLGVLVGRMVGFSRDGDRKDLNSSEFGSGTGGSSGASGDGTITSAGGDTGTLSSGWGRLPSTRTSPTVTHSNTSLYPPSRSLTPSYGNLTAGSHGNPAASRSNSTRPLLSLTPNSPFADPGSITISSASQAHNPFDGENSYVPGSPASGRSWRTEDETLLRASNTLSSQAQSLTRYGLQGQGGRQLTNGSGRNGTVERGLTIVRHIDGGSANYHGGDGDDEGGSAEGGESGEMHLPPSYDDIYHT